jgi:hypothetical protein
MPLGKFRLGQWQDHPPLDDLLCILESLQLVPQPWADYLPAELDEFAPDRNSRRDLVLEIQQSIGYLEAAPLEVLSDVVIATHHAGQLPGSLVREPGLDSRDQLVGNVGID